jgi:glycosyltransferase involved in cell wall biosynthesis
MILFPPNKDEEMPNSHRPDVSIVICTYNRKKSLEECLKSIFSMDYKRHLFEVLIVDKGSTDGTAELCRNFPVRFVTNMRGGLPFQRNKGAELAQGSIVVYTDDDCLVEKNWLNNLLEGFQFSESVAGVGGPVIPSVPNIIPKKIFVKAVFGLFDEGEKTKLTDGIITANSAFKREVFEKIRFDETLGRANPGRFKRFVLKGEDTIFCRDLTSSGYKIVYTPNAKVYHQIRRERISVSYIIEHALNEGVSNTRYYLRTWHSRIWAVRFSLGHLVQNLLRIPLDTSFTSCHDVVCAISTLIISFTGLDKILL